MKEKIANTLRIVIISFLLSTAIGYSLADWAPPAGAPPFNNTPPPINVGPASQIRDGNLFLNNWLFAKKAETQSTVDTDSGTTLTTKDYVDGRVGAMKYIRGNSCGACPYGSSSHMPNGWASGSVSECNFKDQAGAVHPGVEGPGTTPWEGGGAVMGYGYQCNISVGVAWWDGDKAFYFWSY